MSFFYKKAAKEPKAIFYQVPESIITDDYEVNFSDPHSQEGFCLIRAEIINKTSDFLILDRSKVVYTVEGKSQKLKAKYIVIKPHGKKKAALKSTEMAGLPARVVDVEFGGMNRLPVEGKIVEMEDYPLPDTKKEIIQDKIHVQLVSLVKKTQYTQCKFQIENKGDHPLLFNRSKINCTAEGNEDTWPIEGKAADYKILWPGKKTKIGAEFRIPGKIVDMQFANMLVHWNETFLISELVEFESSSFNLQIDEAKTEERN